jgi:hypothetical protein
MFYLRRHQSLPAGVAVLVLSTLGMILSDTGLSYSVTPSGDVIEIAAAGVGGELQIANTAVLNADIPGVAGGEGGEELEEGQTPVQIDIPEMLVTGQKVLATQTSILDGGHSGGFFNLDGVQQVAIGRGVGAGVEEKVAEKVVTGTASAVHTDCHPVDADRKFEEIGVTRTLHCAMNRGLSDQHCSTSGRTERFTYGASAVYGSELFDGTNDVRGLAIFSAAIEVLQQEAYVGLQAQGYDGIGPGLKFEQQVADQLGMREQNLVRAVVVGGHEVSRKNCRGVAGRQVATVGLS